MTLDQIISSLIPIAFIVLGLCAIGLLIIGVIAIRYHMGRLK